MSPLVFALLFVVAECLVLIVAGSWIYARHKARLDEIDHAGGVPGRMELAERLIAAHQAVTASAAAPGAERILGETGREKVMEALRGLAGRLACNDTVSPLYTEQMIRLCLELAGEPPAPAVQPQAESEPEPQPEPQGSPEPTAEETQDPDPVPEFPAEPAAAETPAAAVQN